MPTVTAKTRAKVFFIGLFPIAVVIIFLVVANIGGFPFWRAVTEKIQTDPTGYRVVTKVLETEVSSRNATQGDMIVEFGGSRTYAWLGIVATLSVAALGALFVVTAFLPEDNKLLKWVVTKVNEPPTKV